ncbi:S-layer homology domain-containing protein [Paenibacillus sp. 1P07SE]|uniref:S-layer homology domain-containing protein n=1 Tax=Paenibacillus sp. 1P07SE TaxID=3132209 RepID=UPI0039A47E7A
MGKSKLKKWVTYMLFFLLMISPVLSPLGYSLAADQEDWISIVDRDGLESIREDLSGNYRLDNDIDLGSDNWIPIGKCTNEWAGEGLCDGDESFSGIFDGQGYVIRNMTIDGYGHPYIGLFRATTSEGEIRNVGVTEIHIQINSNPSYIGGLVGRNYGQIENVSTTGSIIGNTDGYIGGIYSGGIAGQNDGEIRSSYSSVDVRGRSYIGGLVGLNTGSVSNAYATGDIIANHISGLHFAGGLIGEHRSGNVSTAYAVGNVSPVAYYTGALFGEVPNNLGAVIDASYWNTESTGHNAGIGGNYSGPDMEGKTDGEMRQKSTFTDWDFEQAWAVLHTEEADMYAYPRLIGDFHANRLTRLEVNSESAASWDVAFEPAERSYNVVFDRNVNEVELSIIPFEADSVIQLLHADHGDHNGARLDDDRVAVTVQPGQNKVLIQNFTRKTDFVGQYELILHIPYPGPMLSIDSMEETAIHLSWESVHHADEYVLVRDDEEVYRGTSTSYVDTGLDPNTAYEYSLVSVYASGTSDASTVTATTTFPPSDFEYTDNGDGTATINGWNNDSGHVPHILVIPREINGLTVTRIRDGSIDSAAFRNLSIEKLTLPDSLEYIGGYAFADNFLKSVTIPESVTEIGNAAFLGNMLESITIYNNEVNIASASLNDNNASLTLYGWEGSTTADHANMKCYRFIAFDSEPHVNIWYGEEAVGLELSLDFEETGHLSAEYSHDAADIESVTWLVDGLEKSTNEILDLSDYTSTPQTLTVSLRVETEYGAVGTVQIEITVKPPVPGTPSMSVDHTEETAIHLSWQSVQYVVEYVLVRDDQEVYRGTSTSYVDTGLDPETDYDYSLVAVNASGTSEAAEVTARTALPVPSIVDIRLTHVDDSPYRSGAWTNKSVTAAVYAANDAGVPVNTLFYSLNHDEDWQEYTVPLQFSAEGVHLLAVSAQDDTGTTVEAERMIRIDRTAPSIYFETNGNDSWSTFADTTVTVTDIDGPVDANSDVDDASLRYAWTQASSPPSADDTGWATFANGEHLVKKDADGIWYLHIQAADAAGNEAQATTNKFRLDTSDAHLSDLTLSDGELRPAFDEEIYEYTVHVPNQISEVTLTPVTAEDGSSVKVQLDDGEYQEVVSGQSSERLPLRVGDNTVVVEVTALNGAKRHYTLHIVREASRASGGEGVSWPANSRFVGNGGAAISFDGGLIEIPAGAWPGSFHLRIDTREGKPATDTLPLTNEARFVSKIVTLTKDTEGLFEEAITLTLKLDLEILDEDLKRVMEAWTISLYWLDEEASEWVELDNIDLDVEQGTISGEIDHFTNFAAIAHPVEATDETDREDLLEPRDPTEASPQMTFSDLDGHWAEEAIYDLVGRDAIQGYPDGTFQPNQSMTRAEFVAMAVHALNLKGKDVTNNTEQTFFADSEGHWAREAIATATMQGIVSGYDEITFGVNDPITREQLALILLRTMGLPSVSNTVTFTDQDKIASWAVEAIAALQVEGVLTGYPDGSVRPQQELTRAEAAVVVSKVLGRM